MIVKYTSAGEMVKISVDVKPLAELVRIGCCCIHSEIKGPGRLVEFSGCTKARAEELVIQLSQMCGSSYSAWLSLGPTL